MAEPSQRAEIPREKKQEWTFGRGVNVKMPCLDDRMGLLFDLLLRCVMGVLGFFCTNQT